jgi:uncharacterized membrane protein
MARANKSEVRLDTPKGMRTTNLVGRKRGSRSNDRFGRFTEAIARGMGTPWFLLGLTAFTLFWIGWNTLSPLNLRFDSIELGFIALTLVLSLQASYAAPLILLAQNRQDDRDRVQFEQDRQRAERNLSDTEYLAREVVALRLGMKDLASKDFLRAELRAMLDNLDQRDEQARREAEAARDRESRELESREREGSPRDSRSDSQTGSHEVHPFD